MRYLFLFFAAIVISCAFYSSYACAYDEDYAYDGIIKFVVPDLPRFEEFSNVEKPIKQAKDINFESFDGAWNFRTRLRKGLKEGPNYAGKYKIVTHGCGSPCQVNWIIDTETGDVIDKIGSSHGIRYRVDSRLIIRHLIPYKEIPYEMSNQGTFSPGITFYTLRDDKLFEMLTLRPPVIKWDDPKYPFYKGYP